MKAEEMELKIINSYVEMLRASKVVRKNSGSNSGLMRFPPFQGVAVDRPIFATIPFAFVAFDLEVLLKKYRCLMCNNNTVGTIHWQSCF
jgi:hypothetical protein